jgi:hypothetical protein
MQIEDTRIKAKRLDARDIKAEFDMAVTATDKAAMKPKELREVISDLFKLSTTKDGEDIIVYYVQHQQIHQEDHQ